MARLILSILSFRLKRRNKLIQVLRLMGINTRTLCIHLLIPLMLRTPSTSPW